MLNQNKISSGGIQVRAIVDHVGLGGWGTQLGCWWWKLYPNLDLIYHRFNTHTLPSLSLSYLFLSLYLFIYLSLSISAASIPSNCIEVNASILSSFLYIQFILCTFKQFHVQDDQDDEFLSKFHDWVDEFNDKTKHLDERKVQNLKKIKLFFIGS